MLETFFRASTEAEDIRTIGDLESFIHQIIDAYQLKHAAYCLPGMPSEGLRPVSIIAYAGAWVRRSLEADCCRTEQEASVGLDDSKLRDWSMIDRHRSPTRQFLGKATEVGVGRQGLTFPIRGARGEAALFSVTSSLPDEDWPEARRTCMQDLPGIAEVIHVKAVAVARGRTPEHFRPLTSRERECLTWSAAGKTSKDIGVILKISEGVVRIHLQSAQHKLDCLNRTHTVAKALAHGLISLDIS